MINYDQYDLIILEGFEMTGKTYTLESISRVVKKNVLTYKPSWSTALNDRILSRGNRGVVGISLIDLLNQNPEIREDSVLILDRGLPTSYAYSRYYGQKSDCADPAEYMESLKSVTSNMRVLILHKYHDEGEASKMYQLSTSDNDHGDVYDRFENFSDYCSKYAEFEKLFEEFYNGVSDASNIDIYYMSSYYGKILRRD